MPQFIMETTLCCTVIIFSRAKEEDLFAHQAGLAKEGLAKAAKVGLPLIGKLIQGVSKQQRRKKRRSRKKNKLRKLKGGSSYHYMQSPFGKSMFGLLGLSDLSTPPRWGKYGGSKLRPQASDLCGGDRKQSVVYKVST